MNLIILGPQGSGKGTQAKLIAKRLTLFYFEIGDYLRELAETDSRIDEIVNKKGVLLPDEEIFSYVSKYLAKNDSDLKNFILDGYPRSVKQYQLLKDWLQEKGSVIDKAIFLNISEEESLKRLSARRICEDCGNLYDLITNTSPKGVCECGGKLIQREDDQLDTIKKRLAEYQKQTMPVIDQFRKEGILLEIDGERPIETIYDDILKKLKT